MYRLHVIDRVPASRSSTRWLAERLSEAPLFACVGPRDLAHLAAEATRLVYREGETVVAQGQQGIGFYVILDGCAAVSVDGELRRALNAGDSFGELCLVGERRRSATVVAATDLDCAVLTAWDFRPFLEAHPCVADSLAEQIARYRADETAGLEGDYS